MLRALAAKRRRRGDTGQRGEERANQIQAASCISATERVSLEKTRLPTARCPHQIA